MSLQQQQNAQGGRLAGLFVRRPVLAVVINALIVVGGLAAFLGVEVRELPQVDQPVLTVNTTFTGASADTVDRQITSVIEGAVARVQGLTGVSSSLMTWKPFGVCTGVSVTWPAFRLMKASLNTFGNDDGLAQSRSPPVAAVPWSFEVLARSSNLAPPFSLAITAFASASVSVRI